MAHCFNVCLTSIVLLWSLSIVATSHELGSPIRIAQCRALCLDKFLRNDRYDTLCQQDPDCFTCWENCGLLQDNPTAWMRICNQPSTCFPGCAQACQFFQHADVPQKDPVMPSSAEPTVQLTGNLATWPRPSTSSSKREKQRLVYAVILKQPTGHWRQIIQTAQESCFLPAGETPNSVLGNLRVIVVSGRGLVALYRPENEDPSTENIVRLDPPSSSDVTAVETLTAGQNTAAAADHQKHKLPVSSQWKLREVSLIHQKVLVIAEVAWAGQKSSDGQAGDYLVTWEVDGGGLKGHLYTDSTSVTLSLWPDTVYHIQVELVTGVDSVQMRSLPLTIDTHQAPLVTDEENIFLAAPLVDTLSMSTRRSVRLDTVITVGVVAAVSFFLLAVLVVLAIRRHHKNLWRQDSELNILNAEEADIKTLDYHPVEICFVQKPTSVVPSSNL